MDVSCLALYLLGPPRAEVDAVSIEVDTRKAIALLAYFAITRQSHRRSSLVNLLWPDYDRSRGRAALRRTLYALRKALGGEWLLVEREEAGLNPSLPGDDELWVDVDAFRGHLARCDKHGHPSSETCPACLSPLGDAVALYWGDFMAGFGLRDSVNFDDWQYFQAEKLRSEFSVALERLVQAHAVEREFQPAIGYARRRLALDLLDESAHCALMKLYAWSGQRSAALRQYQECVDVLYDQLGVAPEPATVELNQAIADGRAPAPPAPEPSPAQTRTLPAFLERQPAVERPVFVAREHELERLGRFLDATLAGQGGVVFVTGEAGSGKTALILEFALRAQEAHQELVVACGHGNAHTGAGDPYLPFREVLGLLGGDIEAQLGAGAMTRDQALRLWCLIPSTIEALVEHGADLIDLFVPGVPLLKRAAASNESPARAGTFASLKDLVERKASSPGNPNLQQRALFEQYTQVLRALARRSPLLLALDDMQWADTGSANLLFHLGRRIEGSRILVVCTYRPAEVALGRSAYSLTAGAPGSRERHPLEPVVNEFKRYFGDIEIDLERAEGREARGRRFVDAFLDHQPNRLDESFRQTLHAQTEGHPLFTVELVRDMQKRGDLVQEEDGRWTEGPGLAWETLPVRVEAVVAERIGRLPGGLREVLTVASVEGETFCAEVAARVQAIEPGAIIHSLSETADRQHRLVRARGIVSAGGCRLSQYRFRHILFQRHLYGSLDPVRRAYLHQSVGSALEALYGGGTGDEAATEGVAAQLARHYELAGNTEKAVTYLQQAAKRARRLYANAEAIGHLRRALVVLDAAPADPTRRAWQREMAAQLYDSLGDVLEWTGKHEDAKLAFQEALERVPQDDGYWEARLHCKAGNIWRLQRKHQEAGACYERAVTALGEEPGDSAAAWWQAWIQIQLERMWMWYWQANWRHMSALVGQARPAVEQHGTPSQRISFFLCLASMNNRRDRYVVSPETLSYCQTALAISRESEDWGEVAWAEFMLGFSELWHGDLKGAERHVGAALALAEQTGDAVHQSRCLTYLTVVHRMRGQVAEAERLARRSLSAAETAQVIEYVGMARGSLAWVAWRQGDLSSAKENGQAAIVAWEKQAGSLQSCAFQWVATWPLLAVALAGNQTSEALGWARALRSPPQQYLPESLDALVVRAIGAWDGGAAEEARLCLEEAAGMARELGYL